MAIHLDQDMDPYNNQILDDPKPYQFSWQNPILRRTCYPFREKKLRDFLLYYDEIDLVKKYKNVDIEALKLDPEIQNALKTQACRRDRVQALLRGRIEEKKLTDVWFGKITGTNDSVLRWKQVYYLDRQIDDLEEDYEQFVSSQKSLLKRKAWYSDPEDPHIAEWQKRADAEGAKAAEILKPLKRVKRFRTLFSQEDALPPPLDLSATATNDPKQKKKILDTVLLALLRQKRKAYEALDHDELLKLVIDRIQGDPDRFPEWLVYMVIHFSGMRYQSAHSSWADPVNLLELLSCEDLEEEVGGLPDDAVIQACEAAVQELTSVRSKTTQATALANLDFQIRRLQLGNRRRALLEFRRSKVIDQNKDLPEEAALQRLVEYKAQKENTPDCIPDWVWKDIVKYTPLRNQTEDETWEVYSTERWQTGDSRWRQMLSAWENKDITAWRSQHKESFSLVVTRAVCNEIAEHIQHLRGVSPAAGLAAKPVWYLREQSKRPGEAFFKSASSVSDFIPGASILWLEWVSQQPNAWQIARPITGLNLWPNVNWAGSNVKDSDSWSFRQIEGGYIRTRKPVVAPPSKQQLQKQGKNKQEIDRIVAEYAKANTLQKQYLRWRHEATVISVEEMIQGWVVLTFETGEIGIRIRTVNELLGGQDYRVFIGYVPEAEALPKEMDNRLVDMLRWDRIQPLGNHPPRIRPLKKPRIPTPTPGPGATPAPSLSARYQVMVIRDKVRCYQVFERTKNGVPFMSAAQPRVEIPRGARLQVDAKAKESDRDSGDGTIHDNKGELYYLITDGPAPARGLFIDQQDVTRITTALWVKVNDSLAKINTHTFMNRDAQNKPDFKPNPAVQLMKGTEFQVSATHRESDKDPGDGTILGTGLQEYYLIVTCPGQPAAEGFYVQKEEVVKF